jgi:tRNA-Thr(GGU) m(6)t(6)A37 methyltransferase TsaA
MAALFIQSCAIFILFHKLRQTERELDEAITMRNAERNGRINIQKQTREEKKVSQFQNGYRYQPIGTVESPFPERRGTPRQPILVTAGRGRIKFDKRIIQAEHFQELKEFSHIWVIFVFHDNTNDKSVNNGPGDDAKEGKAAKTIAAKIRPPRLHGTRVGCLSTRSPHRPNNIGLSVCEIVSVGADYIEIGGLDMVDGTPVLDVKPYIPYDIIPSTIDLPMLKWAEDASQNSKAESTSPGRTCDSVVRSLSVPGWIFEADIPLRRVKFETSVRNIAKTI